MSRADVNDGGFGEAAYCHHRHHLDEHSDDFDTCPHSICVGARSAAVPPPDPLAGRTCTCHPDDNPPKPCPQKYALSECEAAAPSPAKIVDHAFVVCQCENQEQDGFSHGCLHTGCAMPRSAHER